MRRTLIPILALLLLAGTATAQTIDPGDYFPLGVFNRWQFEQQGGDPEDVFDVVVKNVSLHKGNPVYNLRFPELGDVKEARFLFGFEEDQALSQGRPHPRVEGGDDRLERGEGRGEEPDRW